jgi:hypothetical protein
VTFSSLLPRERRNRTCHCDRAIPTLFSNSKNPNRVSACEQKAAAGSRPDSMKAGDAESDLKGPLNTTRAKFFSSFERSTTTTAKSSTPWPLKSPIAMYGCTDDSPGRVSLDHRILFSSAQCLRGNRSLCLCRSDIEGVEKASVSEQFAPALSMCGRFRPVQPAQGRPSKETGICRPLGPSP